MTICGFIRMSVPGTTSLNAQTFRKRLWLYDRMYLALGNIRWGFIPMVLTAVSVVTQAAAQRHPASSPMSCSELALSPRTWGFAWRTPSTVTEAATKPLQAVRRRCLWPTCCRRHNRLQSQEPVVRFFLYVYRTANPGNIFEIALEIIFYLSCLLCVFFFIFCVFVLRWLD